MKVLIIEDEAPAIEKLKKLLQTYDPEIQVLAELSSVEEADKWFSEEAQPDLIFSDIQLSDGLSFEIFENLNLSCPIIFTTAYNQYAIEAFEHNGIGYLLKPFNLKNLAANIDKFKQLKNNFSSPSKLPAVQQLMDNLSQGTSFKSRFLVKNGNKISTIKTNEIAYFFSDQKMSFLVTNENKKFPVDYSLDDIIQMLNVKEFFRVNRKYVINIDAAKEINPYFKGRLKITLSPNVDEEIIISNDRASEFKTWLDQ